MAGLKVVGLGGSLRAASRSRAALAVALDGASAAGATVELLDLRRLELPIYNPELEPRAPAVVRPLIETCYEADGMLWSSPMYNGSVSGSECDRLAAHARVARARISSRQTPKRDSARGPRARCPYGTRAEHSGDALARLLLDRLGALRALLQLDTRRSRSTRLVRFARLRGTGLKPAARRLEGQSPDEAGGPYGDASATRAETLAPTTCSIVRRPRKRRRLYPG